MQKSAFILVYVVVVVTNASINARITKERFPRFWRLKNGPNDNNIIKVFSPQCTSPTPVSFGLASLTFPEDALLLLGSEYALPSSFFGRCFAS